MLLHEELGDSRDEWDKVCKAANKVMSLLLPDSKTADVTATFTSHATGKRRQHVVEFFATDVDDDCKMYPSRHSWKPRTACTR